MAASLLLSAAHAPKPWVPAAPMTDAGGQWACHGQIVGNRRARRSIEDPIIGPELNLSGADDGIRTRDPHLGKVRRSVQLVRSRVVTWTSVGKAVRLVHLVAACCRPVY